MMPNENESDATARTDAGPETSTEFRETEDEQKDARFTEDFSFFDARSSLALAAIDAKLAAAADSLANDEERHEKPTRARALREKTTEETTPEPDLSNDACVREDPNEFDSVEPFGGDDAAKKLASVDARLKTFATRRG